MGGHQGGGGQEDGEEGVAVHGRGGWVLFGKWLGAGCEAEVGHCVGMESSYESIVVI